MLPAKRKVRYFEDKPNRDQTSVMENERPIKKLRLENFQKTLNDKKGILKNNKQANFKNEKTIKHPKKFNQKFKKIQKNADGTTIDSKQTKLNQMKWKERKQERKKSENKVFEISVKAKSIWEIVRRDDCSKEKKEKLLKELLNLVKGHVKQLIFAHDTSRVIESIVSLGSEEHRTALFEELKDSIGLLATSKYAKFFLIKMLSYGTKQQKDIIMKSFEGKIVSLIRHTEAAAVVECAYNEYANVKQRLAMIQEFYGSSFKFFKDTTFTSLSDLISKDPTKKEEILNFMKPVLLRILEKSVVRHSIVHHVLREYMEQANESGQVDIIAALRTGLVEILHTKDGSRVAMMCLWNGSSKDRKAIVKSMKTHVVKIAKEEQGHLVLLAAFDSLDDVKLIERIVIQELMRNCLELSKDQFGRKVLLYLMSPRDSRYFHPDIVNILKRGDGNPHSKKIASVRQEELRQAASPDLLKFAAENVKHLLSTNATCMLLLSILKNSSGNISDALESFVKLLIEPYYPAVENDMHMVEHAGLSFVFTKLLKDFLKENNDRAQLFITLLLDAVPVKVLRTWVECNRGAFLLLNLLETNIPSVVENLKKELKSVIKILSMKKYKGAELLLRKLKE